MTVDVAGHWAEVYARRAPEEVSWYEPQPTRSLELVRACGVALDAAIIDVGGGTSGLAAALVAEGYRDVTVADISASALARAEERAGASARHVQWLQADVRRHEFARRYEVWHDRAVFHFMVTAEDRDGYLSVLRRTLRPDGHLLLFTFGPQGPEQCSGLPTARYDVRGLAAVLGEEFEEVTSGLEDHLTPSGATQQFLFARFRRSSDS